MPIRAKFSGIAGFIQAQFGIELSLGGCVGCWPLVLYLECVLRAFRLAYHCVFCTRSLCIFGIQQFCWYAWQLRTCTYIYALYALI